MAHPIEITDDIFDTEVLKADIPVLLEFSAQWCKSCQNLATVIKGIAEEHGELLKVAKLDIDYNSVAAMRYGVETVPTLLLFKNAQLVDRMEGVTVEEELLAKVRTHIRLPG